MPAALRAVSTVFVDSGAWIALALSRDPMHGRAAATWHRLRSVGTKVATSVPIVLETFTFLERNARVDVALTWKDRLYGLPRLSILECTARDVRECWKYFRGHKLHKLSATDATSFVLMRRERIKLAFTFDHHFAAVGFRLVE